MQVQGKGKICSMGCLSQLRKRLALETMHFNVRTFAVLVHLYIPLLFEHTKDVASLSCFPGILQKKQKSLLDSSSATSTGNVICA